MKNLVVLLVGLPLAFGCGAPDEDDLGAPRAGVVRGVVDYAGTIEGPLRVAVFPSFPPRGAPLAVQVIEEPLFPQPYEIAGVPPGRWFVLAILDRDRADGERFHPTIDPGGAVGRFEAPASVLVDGVLGAEGQDIELVDPDPSSPWASGHYR